MQCPTAPHHCSEFALGEEGQEEVFYSIFVVFVGRHVGTHYSGVHITAGEVEEKVKYMYAQVQHTFSIQAGQGMMAIVSCLAITIQHWSTVEGGHQLDSDLCPLYRGVLNSSFFLERVNQGTSWRYLAKYRLYGPNFSQSGQW